jgi:Flp pilus assembly pilin Flp
MSMRATIRNLMRDTTGTSVTEFGLIAPAVLVMMMGTFDIGHVIYVKSVLNGALQEVGRNSALEGATNQDQRDEIDDKMKASVQAVIPGSTIDIKRRYYKTFSQAAAAKKEDVIEDPNDPVKKNGICDSGEKFLDANHNGIWDEDGGTNGQGGARDIVVIDVQVSFKRLFPAAALIGYGDNVVLVSDSVIANQPYGQQTQFAPPVQVNCPT